MPYPVAANPSTSSASLYLLDAHGLIFQMFHGIPANMSAPDGRPTNAVFGVVRALMELYDQGADYLIAAFDQKEPTFREALYQEYKAHRDPPPTDLLLQEPMIHEVLKAMRIPILGKPGFEADDVIATLARKGEERDLDVYLCTSDKDCRQLLSDRVRIRNLRKQENFDTATLMETWGITPKQVCDFQALVGDSVDNIPGVYKCGPKTATKWLKEYHTLEGVIENAANIKGVVGQNLKEAIETGKLALSRKLVELDTNVPIDIDWDGWKRRDWDGQRLLELFQEYGFRGFANKVRTTLSASGKARNDEMLDEAGLSDSPMSVAKPKNASLFDMIDGNGDPEFPFGANAPESEPAPEWKTNYTLIDSNNAFTKFLAKLQKQKRFCFDLETTALHPRRASIVGTAFSWKESEAYYIPMLGPEGSITLDGDTVLSMLKPIFENAKIAKVNQNIKYDQIVLRNHDVTLRGVVGDSMIADYLLHSGERSHSLDDMTLRYFQHENVSIKELIGTGKKQITMAEVEVQKVSDYACEDADAAWRLTEKLEAELVTEGLKSVYDDIEIPLIDTLAELEFNGIRLDVDYLKTLSVEMETQLSAVEKEIHAVAGKEFNIASPKQLREVLFDEMKLPTQKKTGTTGEASTDQETLEKLAALGHELPKKIIEYRQIAKLKGTYVDALPELVNPTTGRLHTSFNQTVASTGRLSSSDPNLQNIPMRTDQGRQIRQAFLPQEGWQLVTADYSQVELRLLAHFCQDEQLLEAFATDRDVHSMVAAEIFQVKESEVTADQRRMAKTVNFGVIYGMSAGGLSTRLSIPRADAEKFIDEYFARYPKVLAYQDNLLKQTRRAGYVATPLGRRRTFDSSGIREFSRYQGRTQAEREAINMEIQGTAADLMKLAMLRVHRRFIAEKLQARLLLTVHDELVFEAPTDEVETVCTIAQTEMAGAMELSVKLKVDVGIGPNWLDVVKR